MRRKDKETNNRKRLSLAAKGFVCFAVALVLLSGYSIAKYISSEKEEPLYVAKNFYFESDILTVGTNGVYPEYVLQAGVDDIELTLKNYPDELRYSEVNIEGEVNLGDVEEKVFQLTGNQKTDQKIVFENVAPGTYIIIAKATSPYIKTLGAKITVVGLDSNLKYSVNDAKESPNLLVTINTTDYEGNASIEWPSGVVPDNTDPLLSEAEGNSCIIQMKKNSEYTFQFFKIDPNEDYTKEIQVKTVGGSDS